jgi:hypothetical protein
MVFRSPQLSILICFSFSNPILEETSSVSDHLQQSSAILVELQNSQYYRQPILQAFKDQFRPSPAARHLMEPHNSELYFSALDGDKRRRKARKIMSAANTGSTESIGLSDQQHKRRKLIKPKFSGNGSSGNVNIGSQDNASRMTQNVELPDMTLHIDFEENNTGFQGYSDCEGNEKVANCVVTPSNANGDNKEALQDVGPVSSEYGK